MLALVTWSTWWTAAVTCGLLLRAEAAQTWKTQKSDKLLRPPQGSPPDAFLDYWAKMKENLRHLHIAMNTILIPRVPGSRGNQIVRDFITGELRPLGWQVELDAFEDPNTIVGRVPFVNIVATLDPSAPRRLVLACHYDSKMEPKGFLGATDSAVPCAQLLNLAHTLQYDLNDAKGKDVTLQLIFFDGEEAFKEWTATDSIYGSRHLAQKWKGSPFTHQGVSGNFLDRIDVLVLLDLLGAEDLTIYSMNPSTHAWYQRLSVLEDSLARLGLACGRKIFAGTRNSRIQDDHIPFQRNGVNILHLIASPFPRVWHTLEDNAKAIDILTVEKLNKILRLFVAEYLELN